MFAWRPHQAGHLPICFLIRSARQFAMGRSATESADAIQMKFMEERIVLVDANDRALGPATKRECHLRTTENPSGLLHRAFSVFLFDSQNRLLLQRRASAKITFPNMWTNSCCSHPLFCESELDSDNHLGVKRAAVRKLDHELGISAIQPEDLRFITRIEYTGFQDDQIWVEHELDYLLFGRADVHIVPNPNEVAEYRFVSKEELKEWRKRRSDYGTVFTPWFDLICTDHLWKWWTDIDKIMSSEPNDPIIHRLGVYQAPESTK